MLIRATSSESSGDSRIWILDPHHPEHPRSLAPDPAGMARRSPGRGCEGECDLACIRYFMPPKSGTQGVGEVISTAVVGH
jgi:hypothetical protein